MLVLCLGRLMRQVKALLVIALFLYGANNNSNNKKEENWTCYFLRPTESLYTSECLQVARYELQECNNGCSWCTGQCGRLFALGAPLSDVSFGRQEMDSFTMQDTLCLQGPLVKAYDNNVQIWWSIREMLAACPASRRGCNYPMLCYSHQQQHVS